MNSSIICSLVSTSSAHKNSVRERAEKKRKAQRRLILETSCFFWIAFLQQPMWYDKSYHPQDPHSLRGEHHAGSVSYSALFSELFRMFPFLEEQQHVLHKYPLFRTRSFSKDKYNHTYAYIHIYTHTYTHIHTHTYIHIHTYTHTHIHTCTHARTIAHAYTLSIHQSINLLLPPQQRAGSAEAARV